MNSYAEIAQPITQIPSNESSNMSCGGSCSDKETDNHNNSKNVNASGTVADKKLGRKRRRLDMHKGGGNGDTPRPDKPERKITDFIKVCYF